MSRVEIATLPDGRGVLFLDGLDMSQYVRRVTVDCQAGHPTEVNLELRAGMTLDLDIEDPVVTMIRTSLITQGDCICTEILPELGAHSGGLSVDPECPKHGRITP